MGKKKVRARQALPARATASPKSVKESPFSKLPQSTMFELLGGMRVLGKSVFRAEFIAETSRTGAPYESLEAIAEAFQLTRDEISRTLRIPLRTLARRKNEEKLDPEETDRLLRVSRVLAHALETFGSSYERAAKWLRHPNLALGGVTPLSVMDHDHGVQQVDDVLGRINHGIIS